MRSIILSKDRPAQLDLLLRSIREFASWIVPTILVRMSDEARDGYSDVFGRHDCYVVEEESFQRDIVRLVQGNKYVQFFVDDDVFKERLAEGGDEQFSLFEKRSDIATVSLRINRDINYNYPNQKTINAPKFKTNGMWKWCGCEHDFGYPFCLDGSIYRAADILPYMETLDYSGPNQFEGVMHGQVRDMFRCCPYMICYQRSPIVNIPWNRVQDVVHNHSEGMSPEDMNKNFMDGWQISLDHIAGLKNNACHQPVELLWEKKND